MTPDQIPHRLVELGAEALRRAAYECDGDCGLPEDECWTTYPVAWSAMVAGETHVHGSTEALARTVLAGAASAGGFEWLMRTAEQYQQRAHAAEKALAESRAVRHGGAPPRLGWRAKAARQLAIAGRAALEAVSVLGLALVALWVSDWAQREADSRAVGWLAGFGVLLSPFAALGAWRHRMRAKGRR